MDKRIKKILSRQFFAGIAADKKGFWAAAVNSDRALAKRVRFPDGQLPRKTVEDWLAINFRLPRDKVIAAGVSGLEDFPDLGARLWLKHDIVPYRLPAPKAKGRAGALELARRVAADFDKLKQVRLHIDRKRQVHPAALARLRDYARTVPERDFLKLAALADEAKAKKLKIAFFNSTAAGGGVALMRHALIRLFRLLGVDASWHVLKPDELVFPITKKKFHNILQDAASPDAKLTGAEKRFFLEWSAANARFFAPAFKDADVAVIDDPQPSGMMAAAKKANPGLKMIYRSHIQIKSHLIKKADSRQKKVWDFLWQNIRLADVFISHPIPEFVPPGVPRRKLVFMPAVTDPLDGLNKRLAPAQAEYYLREFNAMLAELGQAPLDPGRPYIIQIARFDPSKGIPHVLEAYRKLRERLKKDGRPRAKTPQLVIAGNGAYDDPEGLSIFAATMQTIAMDTYAPYADDIKIARLPHYDQILNALLARAFVALQLSLAEGFEIKVTEALAKGVPVVAYGSGGIPLQIKQGRTGFVVKTGDTVRVAAIIRDLLKDGKKYERLRRQAAALTGPEYFTVKNAIRWLYLALKAGPAFKPNGKYVDELIFD